MGTTIPPLTKPTAEEARQMKHLHGSEIVAIAMECADERLFAGQKHGWQLDRHLHADTLHAELAQQIEAHARAFTDSLRGDAGWVDILAEEYGEMVAAAYSGDLMAMRAEAKQVAAMAMAIMHTIDKRIGAPGEEPL